jgi:isopentenyl diphosphate isomerase/L-lactate dehydrogenase-like FMN-dependent dehydrogenase
MPVLVAPIALQMLVDPEGECATGRAAASAGVVMCLSTLSTTGPAQLAGAAPQLDRWFQVYGFRDRRLTGALVEQAAEAGVGALVLTVDSPVLGFRKRSARAGSRMPDIVLPAVKRTPAELASSLDVALTWRDVERLAGDSPLPLVIKGILTAEDALLACEHGAAGIVVSNHGGRQLDGVVPSLAALPPVVEAVGGRAEVYVDGGVRRGTHVLVALALGARAVLIGRPLVWGLAVGGEAGARRVLEILRGEFENALLLSGCVSPADVTRAHVQAVSE